MKISIVMASYNYAPIIGEAIESIINQTYKDWELIIVDDGSTDNSVEVIKKYAPAVADTPEDSTYMNQTLFRIFKDDYPKIMKDVLAELEQISY